MPDQPATILRPPATRRAMAATLRWCRRDAIGRIARYSQHGAPTWRDADVDELAAGSAVHAAVARADALDAPRDAAHGSATCRPRKQGR